ncbi:MAG: hypothetical protein Q8P46_13460 [Hyphomicrobiales bacterium]|nr:hypothetical protein [Hyphomicrobiales bacterium]
MAKAVYTMKSGTTVALEGSHEEVVALLARLEQGVSDDEPERANRHRRQSRPRATPTSVVEELISDGFFAVPRDLGTIRIALRDKGHFYPATSLSPVMLRLVRSKVLRRIKEDKRWMYVE